MMCNQAAGLRQVPNKSPRVHGYPTEDLAEWQIKGKGKSSGRSQHAADELDFLYIYSDI